MGYTYGHGYGYTWKPNRRVSASVAPPAVGGGALLVGEANGFATDFIYATDASRVAVKTAGTVVASTVDGFFTNASTSPKMVYDVAGTLVWSLHNTCLQSQTFNVGSWAINALTVIPNAIAAPDGTMTAEAFTPPAGTQSPYISQGPAAPNGAVVTFSVYAKNGTLTPWLLIQSDTSAWFNLATGIKGTTTGGAISSNMVAAGSGWYRCDMTFTAASAAPAVYLAMATSDGGGASCLTGDGVKVGFYLWGAQMNRGTVPTAYLPTTTAACYGLALDYDPVTHASKGLLCEPAATNLALQSNALSDAGIWSIEAGTVTANNQTGPDGTLIADTFTENTATAIHDAYGAATVVANTNYTVSRFYKMGTRRYASIGWSDGTNGAYAVYDLQSGVVGSSAALGTGTLNSASMQACPNGWYRCILSGKFPTGTSAFPTFAAANAASYTPDGLGRQSFLGTGATLFFGHVQIETGTVATSPIPTLGSTVTRAVDRYNATAASIGTSATAGSWWAETYLMGGVGNENIIGLNSAAQPLFYNNTAFELNESVLLYKLGPGIVNAVAKAISTFQAGDRAITFNGLAPSTDAGATTTLLSPTTIYFGNSLSGASPMNGYIRKLRYLPRRPSNAEMQTMTT